MKIIGCFLKIVVAFIIVIGVSYYLYTKFEDDIFDYGREKVEAYITESVENKIKDLENSEIKDRLVNLTNEYIDIVKDKSIDDIYSTTKELVEKIELYLEDKVISEEELSKLKKFIYDAKSEIN